MKAGEFPHLREHRRKAKDGSVVTYFFWDGRSRGIRDIPLGTDRERAIELWRQCELGAFPTKKRGRSISKLAPARQPGRRRKIDNPHWDALPGHLRTMYFNAERRAADLKRSFTLTPEQFLDVLRRAGDCCEVSGIPFEIGGGRNPFGPSLDRIDCSRGYEANNVRMVACIVNTSLSDWGLEPVLRMSEALLRKHRD